MNPIEGVSHMTFIVKNVEKTAKLFQELFGAEEVYDSSINGKEQNFSLSREKFFLIANIWVAIMEGDALKERTYNHIAFKIDLADFDSYVKKIKELGLEIKEGRSRVEADFQSIYFYDYANHLFELHTGTLENRIEGYKRFEN